MQNKIKIKRLKNIKLKIDEELQYIDIQCAF